ncbi:MAG TPA: hypothetical protein VMZ28_19480 [Kofleriaceae bacterium]|nr:hypothetical protein [Kofleriaceae bacterium]
MLARGRTAQIGAALLVAGPLGVIVCAGAGLWLGVPIGRLTLPVGWLLGTALVVFGAQARTLRWRAGAALAVAAAVLVAGVLADRILDSSYDGQGYHQGTILRLAAGWNPFTAHDPLSDDSYRTWGEHFPASSWLFGAAVLRATGRLEAGKVLSLILACAAALALFAALTRVPGLVRRRATLIAALGAFNPIVLCQLTSYYVDGLLASTLLVAAAGAATLPLDPLLAALLAGGGLVLAATVKFSGAVFAVLLVGSALLLRGALARHRRWIAGTAAASVVVGVMLAWHPYVTNLRIHAHPLYPLSQVSARLMDDNLPAAFLAGGQAEKLLIATFSRASNDMTRMPSLKPPLWVAPSELVAYTADTRVGGFGPLFAAACLLALALAVAVVRRAPAARRWLALGGLFAFASAVVMPHCWWARYCPQLWWVPVLVLAAAWCDPATARLRLSPYLAALLVANLGLVSLGRARNELWSQGQIRAQLAALPRDRPVRLGVHQLEAMVWRWGDAGLDVRSVPLADCRDGAAVPSSGNRVCRDAPLLGGRGLAHPIR